MSETLIGASVPRKDSLEKVTGRARFVGDLHLPGMLFARVLRSPYPHARIRSIDVSRAFRVPGVKAVVTGRDFPNFVGLYLVDRNIFAVDKVRFIGDPVAAVAALSLQAAEEALGLIEVECEELPGVFDPLSAIAPDAPLIHENLHQYKRVPAYHPVPFTNIANHVKIRKGDIEEGFKQSDEVFEAAYHVPHMQHCQLEPHAAVAQVEAGGTVTVWSSCQSPNAVRKLLAVAFDIPVGKVRVITPYVGGGFGGKAGVSIEGILVALAMKTGGRPVKLVLTREEVFQGTTVRQGLVARIKTGYMRDGRLIAQAAELFWDAGAYCEYGVNIVRAAAYSSAGPYYIPYLKTDSYCIYTNHPAGGPFRGFGMGELHWALDQQLDQIAHRLGLDPVEIRLINAARDGTTTATGEVLKDIGLAECIKSAAKKIGWDEPKKPLTGKGIACMVKAPAMPGNAASSAVIKLNEDGSANLLITATEIGQGAETVLAQIAAHELGLPVDRVNVAQPDTGYTPYEWQTVASRITYSAGNAVMRAAQDARRQLLTMAAEGLGLPEDRLTITAGMVHAVDDPAKSIGVADLALGLTMPDGSGRYGPVIGRGHFIPEGIEGLDPETGQSAKAVAHWTFGVQAAEVEVDPQTGRVEVKKVAAVYDVGKAINPLLAIGQTEGGIIQGLSVALYEQLHLRQGRLMNPSFVDYKIATAADVPEMDVGFVETPLADGPYGARGFGEHTMVPTAPAIANAVFDAVGVRITDLPITPEKVLAALRLKGKGGE
ncbi:MAG: xanthine dehydrogenase family protein molybdopterin-binding subunit [Bacillota bacterium]